MHILWEMYHLYIPERHNFIVQVNLWKHENCCISLIFLMFTEAVAHLGSSSRKSILLYLTGVSHRGIAKKIAISDYIPLFPRSLAHASRSGADPGSWPAHTSIITGQGFIQSRPKSTAKPHFINFWRVLDQPHHLQHPAITAESQSCLFYCNVRIWINTRCIYKTKIIRSYSTFS